MKKAFPDEFLKLTQQELRDLNERDEKKLAELKLRSARWKKLLAVFRP